MNASARNDVPRKAAFVISRTKPRMRERSVRKERLSPERTSDFLLAAEASCSRDFAEAGVSLFCESSGVFVGTESFFSSIM